jgi:hypothetical protein
VRRSREARCKCDYGGGTEEPATVDKHGTGPVENEMGGKEMDTADKATKTRPSSLTANYFLRLHDAHIGTELSLNAGQIQRKNASE